jgi:hypothetical protein
MVQPSTRVPASRVAVFTATIPAPSRGGPRDLGPCFHTRDQGGAAHARHALPVRPDPYQDHQHRRLSGDRGPPARRPRAAHLRVRAGSSGPAVHVRRWPHRAGHARRGTRRCWLEGAAGVGGRHRVRGARAAVRGAPRDDAGRAAGDDAGGRCGEAVSGASGGAVLCAVRRRRCSRCTRGSRVNKFIEFYRNSLKFDDSVLTEF